jgi:hypothetical protein
MFLTLSDFHQEDFSCIAKLKPIKSTSIIITNEYRGFKDKISMIPQKKLSAHLQHKSGKGTIDVWNRCKNR